MLQGLRARSILLSIVAFLILGSISLAFTYQLTRDLRLTFGEKYAIEHALRHSQRIADMLALNIRLAEHTMTSDALHRWLSNESDETAKEESLKLLNDSLRMAKADSWFVAFSGSEHFYYEDLNRSYHAFQPLKKLSASNTNDGWFYHTMRSADTFNLNIDYDEAVKATKLWMNILVRNEQNALGVTGFGIDLAQFIDAYVLTKTQGFQAIILNKQGAILGHPDFSKVTHNVHTSASNTWKTIWPYLDTKSQKELRRYMQDLPSHASDVFTCKLRYDGKEYTVALAYMPYVDWIGLSMVDVSTLLTLYDMRMAFTVLIVLGCLSAWIAYVLSQSYFLTPIRHLSSVVKAVCAGDYTQRAPLDKETDELSTLSRDVNAMIDMVQEAQSATIQRYRWLAENSHDVIWVMGVDGKFVYVSPSVKRLRGFSAEEVMDQLFEEVICEGSRQTVLHLMEMAIMEAANGAILDAKNVLVEQPCKDGNTVWTEVNARLVVNQQDGSMQFIGITRDITERLAAEEEIKKLAFYDPLTHLANRRLFVDKLESSLVTCKKEHTFAGVIFLDLDDFKPLNDTYGHQAGDELLIEVARRLKETVRATDTVGRFGGDEFVILVAQLGFTREEAFSTVTRIAHQIAAFIAQPYPLSSTVYTLSASIGVLLFNEAQNDAKTILDEADSVMYRAKDAGKACVIVQG
ncbi:diguanylate cyclase [Sulfurospirillum sp. MES]|uniref:diguanylate cyclase n=1 Tax=Sulfurospirillum sp. MES TaxID=1565314 RepID=UPI000A5666A5|nr:diguanylate cyclase [Sulfurospirillum sp. MES]